ncbi:outer membrane beta-barrel protein [Polluticoccus soli]|uniref:outer membrane beta-barrel protein n=1 Tax=Polluticoccus soli TaxID=3034150 RepID=UPI0023E28DE9|nr:outer membrane beta-barrel protein [Flavipsychrobacter sp. JY13-12]
MKSLLLAILSMIILEFPALAKSGNITGKVTDSDGKPLAAANVVILKAEGNTLVKADLTNDNGLYTIESLEDGSYIVKITFHGYETFSSEKITIAGNNLNIPEVVLQPKSGTLKEVAIRGQKPLIEIEANKIVVNVESSIVNAGSSALEVLARSPGVRVDQNDNISLKGKPGVTIMIDGKITHMNGTDLANMLKSMPSNSIDRIELISNPGARYDAAGTGGIINIRTKRNQRIGWSGSINASYAQGIYPKTNSGINLNYRNKKVSLYVNYSYAYRYWYNHLMLNRRFYDTAGAELSKKLFTYLQDNYTVFDFKNHVGSFGMDYSLSKNTTVGFSGSGITNHFNPKADNRSKALDQNDAIMYYFNTTGRHTNMFFNYAGNANLRHTFDTSGKELSVDVDYGAFGNQSNQNFVTEYLSPDGNMYMPSYLMKSNLSGVTQIRSLKADYSNPLRNSASFDAGVKASYVTADNEPLFYEQINGLYVLDTKRSNHFIYNENINAAYTNFKKDWTKWSTQLGLRLENTNAEWEQKVTDQKYDTNYTQLFPSLAVQRHVTEKHDVGITVSRRIQRPDYQQLNPFKRFIDRTTYHGGYPYLQPASSYNFELSHTYNQKFITTFTHSITTNVITEVIQPSDDEDSVTVQTNKNLDRMVFYGVSGSYSPEITKWWTNVTNVNVYYARYEGNIANTSLNAGRPTFDIYTNNTFILPWDLSAELGLFYQAQQLYAYMDVNPNWMLNAGLQKNFRDKAFTARLNVQDIFWKGYPSATSTYSGYQEDFVAERDTRQVTVALTYRFGKKSVAPVRRRNGGAEDEKRRAGNG